MSWTIYCHTHIDSGRRYVGLTKYTMMHRWNQHCVQARQAKSRRSHFLNAISSYGKDSFSHEVLAVCETLEAANEAEREWVEKLGTRDPSRGFNIMKGGLHIPHERKNPWDDPEIREKYLRSSKDPAVRDKIRISATGRSHSPESKMKNSLAHKGKSHSPEHRSKISSSLTGRTLSQETRAKISLSMSGRFLSAETRAKISSTKRNRTDRTTR